MAAETPPVIPPSLPPSSISCPCSRSLLRLIHSKSFQASNKPPKPQSLQQHPKVLAPACPPTQRPFQFFGAQSPDSASNLFKEKLADSTSRSPSSNSSQQPTMKVCTAIVATALTVSSVVSFQQHIRNGDVHRMLSEQTEAATWVDNLMPIANTDSYHMKPVRAIHARVDSGAPVWNATYSMFTSAYGDGFEGKFRGSLDSVNTASVEGALMYVQAEGINYNSRSVDNKCVRKNNMKYIIFYDVVFVQTNETLALYETEYGPYLPMDGGQCTPVLGADATAVFSTPCDYINGDNGQPQIGPFIGEQLQNSDPRAPYPNAYWYSFPNSAVKQKWAAKTNTSRTATRKGLCDYDKLPDGITCTYNYRIAGWVPIDDVVGITAMSSEAEPTKTYNNFSEFCLDGGVEFKGSNANGTWEESIGFWLMPQNSTANAQRAAAVLTTYNNMLTSKKSVQVDAAMITNMVALPAVKDLTAANPKCYFNSKECSTSQYGCKRSLYSQLCTVCPTASPDCDVKPTNYTFPVLDQAVGTTAGTGDKNANGTTTSTNGTTTPTTSGTASISMMGFASVATLALTFLWC